MPADLHIAGSETAQGQDQGPCSPLVPGQLAHEAVAVVDTAFKQFMKAAESELSELLQSPVRIESPETTQTSFEEALKDVGSGERAVALDLAPVPATGFFTFQLPLLFRVLDILLAAPGDIDEDPERSITSIEQHVLREFFDVFARSLATAWQPYGAIAFRYLPLSNVELNLRTAAAAGEPALILSATVELGGRFGAFRLIVPPLLARLAELHSRADDGSVAGPAPSGGVLNCLGDAVLNVDAVLNGARIRLRDLLELTPGRVLVLGHYDSGSFECLVNGTSQFAGELVPDNGRYGIRIGETGDGAVGQ
jgi:flagellar motor switch protein FliM